MSKGNRRVLTAIGLVAFVAFTIAWATFPDAPKLDQLDYGEPRNRNYSPGGSECQPANLASIRDGQVRLDRAEDCQKQAEEYRQSSDDLVQQTRAANAAEAQANIASQGLWTAWFQTIGGFITLAAAIAAAIFARDAAKEGKRSADEAERSRESYIEGERAHLKFISAQASTGDPGRIQIYLRFSNDGTGLAEVDAAAFDWCDAPAWPAHALDLAEGLQVKIAGDTNNHVLVGSSLPVSTPALLVGFVRYRTLTRDDCRTHFAISIEPADTSHGGPDYQATSIDLSGMPHDT